MFGYHLIEAVNKNCNYNCTKPGRFPDESDEDGRNYVLCIPRRNSQFSALCFTCPPNTKYCKYENSCQSDNLKCK